MGAATRQLMRGRKLVVQLVETFSEKMVPVFVEKLDSLELAEKFKLDLAPVMIYGDDVTHIVSEEGIANLLLCRTAAEREQAIRGIAVFTEAGRRRDRKMVAKLSERKIIRGPEDLSINPLDAHRSTLSARSIEDLMHWSGNLYDPPNKFRNWHSPTASRKPTMTLDEILNALFPSGHDVKTSAAGIITGTGKRKDGEAIAVIGVA